MIEKLRNKAYRDAYVESHIKVGIPYQIRALREQKSRKWSQRELGKRCGKQANVISRLEDPEYGGHTIRTLLQLASAFDVALLVKFISYSRFLKEFEEVSPSALEVPSFCDDHFSSLNLRYTQMIADTKYLQLREGFLVGGVQYSAFFTGIYHPAPIKPQGELYAKESEARNIPFSSFVGNPANEYGQRTEDS